MNMANRSEIFLDMLDLLQFSGLNQVNFQRIFFPAWLSFEVYTVHFHKCAILLYVWYFCSGIFVLISLLRYLCCDIFVVIPLLWYLCCDIFCLSNWINHNFNWTNLTELISRWKMTGSLWQWWWTECSCGFSLWLFLVTLIFHQNILMGINKMHLWILNLTVLVYILHHICSNVELNCRFPIKFSIWI